MLDLLRARLRRVSILLAISVLLAPVTAHAAFLSFRIDVLLRDCEGLSECRQYFEADTGLPLPYTSGEPVPVSALFTVDTDVPGYDALSTTFDGPGVGMSVTIGNLTRSYSSFAISVGDWVTVRTIASETAIFPFYVRPDGSIPVPASSFVHSVRDFLSSDLSLWGASGLTPLVEGPSDRWQLFTSGRTLSITQVAEPSNAVVLLGFSLAALAFARRRKLS